MTTDLAYPYIFVCKTTDESDTNGEVITFNVLELAFDIEEKLPFDVLKVQFVKEIPEFRSMFTEFINYYNIPAMDIGPMFIIKYVDLVKSVKQHVCATLEEVNKVIKGDASSKNLAESALTQLQKLSLPDYWLYDFKTGDLINPVELSINGNIGNNVFKVFGVFTPVIEQNNMDEYHYDA